MLVWQKHRFFAEPVLSLAKDEAEMALVTLTTDFGLSDGYVASMKGVMLGINPRVAIVDVTHLIPPQNVLEAAFLVHTVCPSFPEGTIHVVVVDPGVGSARRAIILKTGQAVFVAPDNGVLSYIIAAAGAGFTAVSITALRFWRRPVSPTFHGRDIFAPVAAQLSLGVPPDEFGDRVSDPVTIPIPRPQRDSRGNITGTVLHVDHFGNLVTSIESGHLPGNDVTVEVAGHLVSGLSSCYADASGLTALIGSSGYLEISLSGGSAARFLNVGPGEEVRVVLGRS